MHTVSEHTVAQIISCTCLVTAELVHSLDKSASGLAELNHAGLKVVKRTFNKAVLLLVVGQEVVPKRMLCNDTVMNAQLL